MTSCVISRRSGLYLKPMSVKVLVASVGGQMQDGFVQDVTGGLYQKGCLPNRIVYPSTNVNTHSDCLTTNFTDVNFRECQ